MKANLIVEEYKKAVNKGEFIQLAAVANKCSVDEIVEIIRSAGLKPRVPAGDKEEKKLDYKKYLPTWRELAAVLNNLEHDIHFHKDMLKQSQEGYDNIVAFAKEHGVTKEQLLAL